MFPGGSILMYFSKTGSTGNGGTFGPQEIAIFSINGMPVHTIYLANQVEIVAKRQACNVTQSATSVTLTDTTAVELSSVGSTSKDQQFYIPLNCSANTNISLSFSGDLADSSNAVFSNLSGDANADSVGVQILNGGKPVPTASNTYLKLGLVNSSLSVPLTARYYALKNNALAGSVKAVVTANIIYN
jgi:type 1 fimbria pilin